MDLTDLSQDGDQNRALENMVGNLRVPQIVETSFRSCTTGGF
jgi:hypothetical protein